MNALLNLDVNGILVNEYKNKTNYISQHSDDEKELNKKSGVITVSVGAERDLKITSKVTNKEVVRIKLKPGMVYAMLGQFQKEFMHGIPVCKEVVEPRISFTFRSHIVKQVTK